MGIRVRRGQLADVGWLVSELREFAQKFFGSKRDLYAGDEYTTKLLEGIIEQHVCFIAEREEDGTRMGLICGVQQPHFLNPSIRLLSELFWWVSEPHRGTAAAAKLFFEFVEYGKLNADWVTFGLEERSPVNPDCLTKRGFKLHERNFLMEV